MNPSLLAPLLNKSHQMLSPGEISVISTGGGWGCVWLWGSVLIHGAVGGPEEMMRVLRGLQDLRS